MKKRTLAVSAAMVAAFGMNAAARACSKDEKASAKDLSSKWTVAHNDKDGKKDDSGCGAGGCGGDDKASDTKATNAKPAADKAPSDAKAADPADTQKK